MPRRRGVKNIVRKGKTPPNLTALINRLRRTADKAARKASYLEPHQIPHPKYPQEFVQRKTYRQDARIATGKALDAIGIYPRRTERNARIRRIIHQMTQIIADLNFEISDPFLSKRPEVTKALITVKIKLAGFIVGELGKKAYMDFIKYASAHLQKIYGAHEMARLELELGIPTRPRKKRWGARS